MVILGLHFGHVSGINILKNVKAIFNFISKRITKAPHSKQIN